MRFPGGMNGKRYVVILNRESGMMVSLGAETVAEELRKVFAEHAFAAEVKLVEGTGMRRALEEARDGAAEVVVVGGGDGTVAAAASVMRGSSKPLGVLPLGTFNLAARDLGMPLSPGAAAAALLEAPEVEVDVLEVNGKLYLCVVVLGFYPAMALAQREYHGHWIFKLMRSAWDVLRYLAAYPPLDLEFNDGRKTVRCRTRFAAITNNDYEPSMGLIPRRVSLDDGHFTVYVSRHQTRWGYLRSLLTWMAGRWKEDREIMIFRAKRLSIGVKRRNRVPVMCDGEIEKLRLPFEVTLRAKALKVLAPRLAMAAET